MITDAGRAARLIKSQVACDGSRSDEALCALAMEVRTMEPDAVAIAS
jgi:hypothetical protein